MSYLDFVSLPGEIREDLYTEDLYDELYDDLQDDDDSWDDDSWEDHPSLTAQERNPGLR